MRVRTTLPIPKYCDHCNAPGVLFLERASTMQRTNGSIFGYYKCRVTKCGAVVSCRPGHTTPLGFMAPREVRRLRVEAHDAIDPLWDHHTATWTRNEVYEWIAVELCVPLDMANVSRLSQEHLLEIIERANEQFEKQRTIYARRQRKKNKRSQNKLYDEMRDQHKQTVLRKDREAASRKGSYAKQRVQDSKRRLENLQCTLI